MSHTNLNNNNQDIQPPKETNLCKKSIIEIHAQAAESTRKIASYLINRIEESMIDERQFCKMLHQSDRASLTLQRLSAILGNLIPMEQDLLEQRINLSSMIKKTKELQKTEFELIIHFIKDFGLIKEGTENDIDKIYQDYLYQIQK